MLPFTVFVSLLLWIKSYFILLEIQILLLFEEAASKSADNASGVSESTVVVVAQCCVRVSVDTEKAAAGGGHRGFPPPPPPQAVSRHQLLHWYDSQQPLQGPRTLWSPEPGHHHRDQSSPARRSYTSMSSSKHYTGKLSWWREGEVVCGVWVEKCLKITLTEPKDCITVQEDR